MKRIKRNDKECCRCTTVVKTFGFRVSMTIGLIGTTLGQVFAGLSQQIWQLYLSQGLLFGIGVGCIFIPSIPILGQWFDKRRLIR